MKNDGQVRAKLDAASPTTLTAAANASTSSQVSDPHGGLTKVVSSTGVAFNALQPDPGHVKNDGRASVPRFTVQMPPFFAAAAARFPGLVPSHFVDQGSGVTTGGVSDTTQPAAMHAAARNLDSELLSASHLISQLPRLPYAAASTSAPTSPRHGRQGHQVVSGCTPHTNLLRCRRWCNPWVWSADCTGADGSQQRLSGQAAESSSSLSAVQLSGPTQ